MADTGFSHITITPADEEDEVIEAGLPRTCEPEVAPEAQAPVETKEQPEVAVETEVQAEAPVEPDAPTRPVVPKKDARTAAKGEYRETTLEDLQPQSMPLAQRIVIIAAVICIIGAIVYCIAFMG